MVYLWDDKKSECYRLYVEERKPLDQVMEFWKEKGFEPSKRAFQTQFRRWNFPTKQNPAYKNEKLVARIKELWEQNTGQGDMVKILNSEGFIIKEREIMRVRAKHRWLLRIPNGGKSAALISSNSEIDRQETTDKNFDDVTIDPEAAAIALQSGPNISLDLQPEETLRRQDRIMKMQVDSDERWRTKKRRRRTRGWAGLPADPAGPPRFPSETTLDESKVFLSLDNTLYRQIRDQFQDICHQEGIIKKTIAGPEKWAEARDRLIRENDHLRSVFAALPTQDPDQRALSLDVICTDVTKRMRTIERRMTIADAKNALGLNPEESREIRHAFYVKLTEDHFTSKLETGNEHWESLKQQWLAESPVLQRVFEIGSTDPNYELKCKSAEFICRDVMKRYRDDQTKIDPMKRKWVAAPASGGPGPARAKTIVRRTLPGTNLTPASEVSSNQGKGQSMLESLAIQSDIQIDPTLLLAATDPSIVAAQAASQQLQNSFADSPSAAYQAIPAPTPVYFRLHPQSPVQSPPALWLSTLRTHTLEELHQLSGEKHPGAEVLRITGIVREADGTELYYGIDFEAELRGYLDHVGVSEGGKAIFSVLLREGFA